MYKPLKFKTAALTVLIALALCLTLIFAGCADAVNENRITATYRETVSDIVWEVTYDTETHEIVSICTPYMTPSDDTISQYYHFMVSYRSENPFVVQAVSLSGIALGGDNFKIEQTTKYMTSGTRTDWEVIKGTFPNCTYSESTTDDYDEETGETITITSGTIIFAETITTYEQKIIFSVPVG